MIEINYTFHTEFFRTEILKESVKTFIFVKLLKLRYDLVEHGKI